MTMPSLTDHAIRAGYRTGLRTRRRLGPAVLAFCAWNVLCTAAPAQTIPVTSGPANQTVTSGSPWYYQLSGTMMPTNFGVNADANCNAVAGASASVTFTATTSIDIKPPFCAAAGTTSPAFHAFIGAPPQDFTVSVTPSATVLAGASASYTVSVTGVNGFAGTVSLSPPTGLPAGATAMFGSTTITVSQPTTMTVNTAAGGITGNFSISVAGTSGLLSRAATAVLVVQDFTISVTPSATTLAGANPGAQYTVTVAGVNGFTGTVNLSAVGLPSGATPMFGSTSIAGSGSTTMAVNTALGVSGNLSIAARGTSGSLTRSATALLVVQDYVIAVGPSAQSITSGGTASFTISLTGVNGYNRSTPVIVDLESTGSNPPLINTQPVSMDANTTFTLTITGWTTTLWGSNWDYKVHSLDNSHVVWIRVTVSTAPTFSLQPSAAQSIVPAGSARYTVTVNPTGGFNGSVTFSAVNQYNGVNVTFAPATVAAGGQTTATVTTSASVAPGTYAVGITATGPGGSPSGAAILWLGVLGSNQVVTSSPPGLTLAVDGVNCTSPCSFPWPAGTSHTVSTASLQAGTPGTQYLFSNWSDSGALTHTITAGSSPAMWTANFTTQYYLTTAVNPAQSGSVTPASRWYDSGSTFAVSATPATGYQFSNFSGGLVGSSIPSYLAITAATAVTANFVPQGTSPSTDLSDMAVLSEFVQRHESLVGPNAPTSDGGMYAGLSTSELAVVNSAVDSAQQQLQLLQSQAGSYTGAAYLNAEGTILQNMRSQMQSQVSSAAWQSLSGYMYGFLLPQLGTNSNSYDAFGNLKPHTLPIQSPQLCDPTVSNCLFYVSEINFFVADAVLGSMAASYVQGPDQKDYGAGVTDVKLLYLPPDVPDVPANWQSVCSSDNAVATNGAWALGPCTLGNPKRGTYRKKAWHHYSYKSSPILLAVPVEAQPIPPAFRYLEVQGCNSGFNPPCPGNGYTLYDVYQTPVDLQLKVSNAPTDTSGNVTGCTSDIIVEATITPPVPKGNTAPKITWRGGTAIDNLHSRVPCTVGPTPSITASIGSNLSATWKVNVQGTVTPSTQKIVTGVNSQFSVTANSSIATGATYTWEIIPDDPAVTVAQLPSSPPSCNGQANCTITITASPNGGKATLRVHLKAQATGQDQSTADVRLIIVQISQVNLVVANHVGGGTTTQTFTAPFGPGPLLWTDALWTPPSAAVLVSNSIPSFELDAVSTPAANDPDVIGWLTFDAMHRAPDDSPQAMQVGSGSFVVAASPDGTATIGTNLAGSFQILVCVDTNLSGQCEQGETGVTVPIVMVQATLHKNLSGVVPANPVTDPGGYVNYYPTSDQAGAWTQSEVQAGSGVGCFVGTAYFPFHKEYCAVLLAAELDLLGGGNNGKRGVDRVYAGWAHNQETLGWVGLYKDQPTTASHKDTFVSARNGAITSHPGFFFPNPPSTDPKPELIYGSLLDTGRNNPASGGNSSLLSASNQTSNVQALLAVDPNADQAPTVGVRMLVTAVDSTRGGFHAADPAYTAFFLNQIQFNQAFIGYLVLWSSITGVADTLPDPPTGVSGTPGPIGPPNADRTYAVLLEQPWNYISTFSVDGQGHGALTTDLPGIHLLQSLATVHSATTNCPTCTVVPVTSTNAVLSAPTALKASAEDLQH